MGDSTPRQENGLGTGHGHCILFNHIKLPIFDHLICQISRGIGHSGGQSFQIGIQKSPDHQGKYAGIPWG